MIFKQLRPNDISVTPFVAHKYYEINSSDTSSVQTYYGQYFNGSFRTLNINTLQQDNNQYPIFVHQLLNSMFIGEFADNPTSTAGQYDLIQERILYEHVRVISIPQKLFGEGIKKGTVDMDIDFPEYHVLANSAFEYNNTVPNISDPFTIPTASVWYTNLDTTASISDKQLTIINDGTLLSSDLYQLIPSSSIDGGDYLLTINFNNITDPDIRFVSVEVFQSGSQDTTYNLNITSLNAPMESKITLTANIDTYIIISYMNPLANTIIYNYVSLQKLVTHKIVDDSHGNLIDTIFSQSSYATKQIIDPLKEGEWNFRNGYRKKDVIISNNFTTRDATVNKNHGIISNVEFSDGLYSTRGVFGHTGSVTVDTITVLVQDEFGNIIEQPVDIQMMLPDSNIRIPNDRDKNLYNFKRDEDFAISTMIQLD
jgi:hypothetical protein